MSDKLNPLQKARQKQQAMRDAGIAVVVLTPLEKHFRAPTSLRLAINAKCYDCVGQDGDANWRRQVGTCVVVKCPLHSLRPFQPKAGTDEEDTSGDVDHE